MSSPYGRGAARGRAGRGELLGTALKYPESNGSRLLRERIALFYPGATADNVLVTTGTSEANYTTLWGLLEKGDRAAMMLPVLSPGLGPGASVRGDGRRLSARREAGRAARGDGRSTSRACGSAVSPKTRVVMVTNPNNPTGAVLTEGEMDAIVRVARSVGAWIVSDEVYRGAESATASRALADVLGPIPQGDRHGRPVEGVRPSRTARSAGSSAPPRRRRPPLGVPGLHDPHPVDALRPAGAGRAGAGAPGRDPRANAGDRPPAAAPGRGLGGPPKVVLDLIPPRAGAIALVRYRLPIGVGGAFRQAAKGKIRPDHAWRATSGSASTCGSATDTTRRS